MSDRTVRKSTKDLRKCYTKRSLSLPPGRRARLRTRTRENYEPVDAAEDAMPDNQNGEPAGQAPVPGAPVAAGADGQPAADPPGDPHDADPRPTPPTSPVSSAKDDDHDERISRLEELLKEYRDEKEQRRAKKDSAARRRSNSRSTHSSKYSRRSGSRRRTRTRSPRRRSRSRSRSRSRRSTRSRRRSTSARSSRTRSTSRDRHRRRSSRRSSRSASRRGSRRETRSRTRTRSTSPRRRRSTTSHTGSGSAPKSVDAVLASQYPDMGKGAGKSLPRKGLHLEPYYNLPPDLRSKARSRRSRTDMTFPEYMCGTLNLIAKSVPKETEVHAAIIHAAQVAQDAAGYTWSAVREWSQTCLVHIEDRSEDWNTSSQFFHRERTRLSWMKGKPAQEVRIPCHPHNVDKCDERATHQAEGKTWVHGCAVCVYGITDEAAAQSALTHTVRTCRRKPGLKTYQDDSRSDYRRRGNYPPARKDNSRAEPAKSKN